MANPIKGFEETKNFEKIIIKYYSTNKSGVDWWRRKKYKLLITLKKLNLL